MAEKPKKPEKPKRRRRKEEVMRGPREVLRRTEDLEEALDRLLKKKPT
jgi:hypothetical protein